VKTTKVLLKNIEEFNREAKNKFFYIIFGGFAVDAHFRKITREHEDVDLICWRKDVNKVRKTLAKLGYKSELFEHPQEKGFYYKLHTTDKNKTYSFQIADERDDKNFEISFWNNPHAIFSVKNLKINWKKINGIEIPVVSKNLLLKLKEWQLKFYKEKIKISPEKYLPRQKEKQRVTKHDLKILRTKNC